MAAIFKDLIVLGRTKLETSAELREDSYLEINDCNMNTYLTSGIDYDATAYSVSIPEGIDTIFFNTTNTIKIALLIPEGSENLNNYYRYSVGGRRLAVAGNFKLTLQGQGQDYSVSNYQYALTSHRHKSNTEEVDGKIGETLQIYEEFLLFENKWYTRGL